MTGAASRIALISLACGVAIGAAAAAQEDSYRLLKSKGIKFAKGKYTLAAEEEAFASYRRAYSLTQEANQAIADAGDAADRNQAVVDFRNRVALDSAVAGEMRVAMRDGTTAEEQATRRAALRDRAQAKQQRAMQGLAGARVKPKEAQRLAAQAEAACRKAADSQSALTEQVGEISERYKTLSADPVVKQALGTGRLAPSDAFKKLASSLGVPKKTKGRGGKSLGGPPKNVGDAIAELEKARNLLMNAPFRKGASVFESRDKRRDDTVEAIDQAIARLKGGDSGIPSIERAMALNDGYTGSFVAQVREAIKEAGSKLERAKSLLGGE